jgi:putative FmdB family regulatory protein
LEDIAPYDQFPGDPWGFTESFDQWSVGNYMPLYEYRCKRCNKEFSELFLRMSDSRPIQCRFCGSKSVARLLSSFSYHQTEDSRLADFDTSKPRSEGFYKDSRNVGLWTKKRMKQLGVDLGPKMDEIVEKGRTGKILDEYNH